ncbi:TnsA endonuclease N-terminal domain-containing protein [Paenibacillus sp. FSL L8-0696]|uniref:TnsA endonuclease N-terminal domain-containing protein n=1 Tax=Paenibacillus sp. FSL L8-0696 TaxID=2954524 RepID=UPI003119C3F0
MAKRKYEWTEEKIAKYIKEGRGAGELYSYKPWLNIQDVPSLGRSHRIKGCKTNRLHHFLSDLERNYFYLLEWAIDVIDIREQYPLNREQTFKIAEDKNITHPIDPHSQIPIVMTTDFVITRQIEGEMKYVARTVKPSDMLNDRRVIEKFEIERAYWQQKGVDWGIVTEQEIPKKFVDNIMWLSTSYRLDNEEEQCLSENLLQIIIKEDLKNTLQSILKQFDDNYNLEPGSSLHLFKYLVYSRQIAYDLHEKFSLRWNLSKLVVEHPIEGGTSSSYDTNVC